MAPVHWSLEVRGRLRPKAVLVDADGCDIARVRRDGKVRVVRAGEATDAEGRTWRVVGPGEDLRVSCDGAARATVVDGVLEVGDRSFGWRLAEDGSRTARATSATGGGTVLRVDPGDGDAWARITFDDALPEAFGVILVACVRLLEAEDPLWAPGGPGSSGRRARPADAAPARGAPRDRADPLLPAGADGATGPETGASPVVRLGTRWALSVQGRVRPRILLSDGGDDPLATLAVRGGPVGSLGTATDRDGRRWVAELDGGDLTLRCAGRAMARAQGDELTLGARVLAWHASLEGARTATATDGDGRELLRITPGPGGDDDPWVTIDLHDELPSPLAATLATLFVLLRVDALGRRG